MTFSNPITGGQGALVRPAIKSPNYNPGVDGWSINKDGSAEFNDLTIRGTFRGTEFIINSSGYFIYDGTPANGNLVISITSASGTDSFGNAYLEGFTSYGDPLGNDVTTQLVGGLLSFVSNSTGALASFDFSGMVLDDTTTITKYLNSRLEYTLTTDHPVFNDPGGLYWAQGDSVQRYLRLTSGDDTSHNAAFVWLFGEDASSNPPYIRIDNGAGGQCDATITGQFTEYNDNTFDTYTPTVTGAGTATWSTRTGWYQRIGKMIFFTAYLSANGAGSGTSVLQVSAPTSIYRGTRQVVAMNVESLSVAGTGSFNSNGHAVAFTGGSGATFDRLRTSRNNANNVDENIQGNDIINGTIITITGWYREA